MKEALFDWWQRNDCPAICVAEHLYSKQKKPCGHIKQDDFRGLIKEYKTYNLSSLEKIIQINDLHVPFQDNKSTEACFNFISDFNPMKIVIAGDFLDFYELSTFDKNPQRRLFIQDEIDEGYKILKTLKELCPEIHFIKGNHEDRLRRFLWKNPNLASLKVLELPKLLNLDLLEVNFHEYDYIYRDFKFYHGEIVRQHSSYSAKAVHDKYGNNCSFGHTHRLGAYYKTDARGTTGCFEMGCLCNLNPEYINGIPNWQQGIGVFHFIGNRFFCQQVPIIDNKFIYDGKKYGG